MNDGNFSILQFKLWGFFQYTVDDVEERLQYQFVAIQMIKLTGLADLTDEAGKRWVKKYIHFHNFIELFL